MRKFIAIFGLAAVLAVAGAGFTSNEALAHGGHHHHRHHGHWGWGFGGLASGLALGFALNQPSTPSVQYVYPTYYGCNPYNPYYPCVAPAPAPIVVPVQ